MYREQAEQVQDLVNLFTYKHLIERDPDLADVSRPFCELARLMFERFSSDGLLLAALHDLMRAKDSAVRLEIVRRNRIKEQEKKNPFTLTVHQRVPAPASNTPQPSIERAQSIVSKMHASNYGCVRAAITERSSDMVVMEWSQESPVWTVPDGE